MTVETDCMEAARSRDQSGFTLLELLVVIAVLGVLSGVAVFSLGTITDSARVTACETDERVLKTAAEAYHVSTGGYGDEDALVAANFLIAPSTSHDIVLNDDGYSIVATGDCAAGSSEEMAEGLQDEAVPDGVDAEQLAAEKEATAEKAASENAAAEKAAEEEKAEQAAAEEKTEEQKRADDEKAKEQAEEDEQKVVSSCKKGQIDLNSASVKDLTQLPHVNPSRAEQIVKLRPFTNVDELVRVNGISIANLAQIHRQGKACV